jgi:glycine hydroxymethyltransferase
MHVIAAKAVAFGEALQPSFKEYQGHIVSNAKRLAAGLEQAGLRVVSGGTDNHLMMVDVSTLGLTGKEAEHALDEVGITVNKNAIPYDPQPPAKASGIRVGTPAVTTRGFREPEMDTIARLIGDVLRAPNDEAVKARVSAEVLELCGRFPVPGLGQV